MRAALAAVVEALAPNLGEQCFYRQIEGGWESLAALGIGDPRSAIPNDFAEEGFWAEVFEPPAAGCDVPTDVHIPVSINASWSDGRNAWIGFSVWEATPASGSKSRAARANTTSPGRTAPIATRSGATAASVASAARSWKRSRAPSTPTSTAAAASSKSDCRTRSSRRWASVPRGPRRLHFARAPRSRQRSEREL